MSGKGDKPRPVDPRKWDENYERIFARGTRVAAVSPDLVPNCVCHWWTRVDMETGERLSIGIAPSPNCPCPVHSPPQTAPNSETPARHT
mgnify:CR=1 FL=1